MNLSITKQFRFEAAHSLPNHDGKCRNLHGHSYLLEVTVSGIAAKSGPKEGMIMDFGDLSKIVEAEIVSKWDHRFLNDLLPFATTSENLAAECFRRLDAAGLSVARIRLWETAKAYADAEAVR